jgi:hypothetical protein
MCILKEKAELPPHEVFFLTREELLEGKSVAVRAAVDPPW